jgi:hypothetical protein
MHPGNHQGRLWGGLRLVAALLLLLMLLLMMRGRV